MLTYICICHKFVRYLKTFFKIFWEDRSMYIASISFILCKDETPPISFLTQFSYCTVEILAAHKGPNGIKLFTECDKSDSFLPFGSGSRACVGQKFAILGISMFVASLLHIYEVCYDNCCAYLLLCVRVFTHWLPSWCYIISFFRTCRSLA